MTGGQWWGVDPLGGPLALMGCWLWARGVARTWGRHGRGAVVAPRQVACGWMALAALAVALIGPVEAGAATSFALHMTQHLLLTLVAAPLLALAAPDVVLRAGLPAGARRRTRGLLPPAFVRRAVARPGAPVAAVAVHIGVLWLWHVPAAYEAAIANPLVHAAEHATMLATAVWVWGVAVHRVGRLRHPRPAGALALFATAALSVGLGMVIALAPYPLYAPYAVVTGGLEPLVDQQLAGALMVTLGGFVHGVGGALVVGWWLKEDEARAAAGVSERDLG